MKLHTECVRALEIANYSFKSLNKKEARIMHVNTHLMYCIGNVRTRSSRLY